MTTSRPAAPRRRALRWLPLLPLLLGSAAGPAAAMAPSRSPRAGPPDSLVIAVMPLGADARDTLLVPLAFGLADLLATDLARSKLLTLVERARLAEALRELELAAVGAVDSATAPRAGRMLRAGTIITGSLTRRPDDELVFAIRVDDVVTGRTDTALVRRAPLADVLSAEKQLVLDLFQYFGVQLTPQERALVEQRPTRDLAALLAYGQGVRAEVNGQYAAARVPSAAPRSPTRRSRGRARARRRSVRR